MYVNKEGEESEKQRGGKKTQTYLERLRIARIKADRRNSRAQTEANNCISQSQWWHCVDCWYTSPSILPSFIFLLLFLFISYILFLSLLLYFLSCFAAMKKSTSMFAGVKNDKEKYQASENTIIILTDLVPTKDVSTNTFVTTVKRNAQERLYTTIVGIGSV